MSTRESAPTRSLQPAQSARICDMDRQELVWAVKQFTRPSDLSNLMPDVIAEIEKRVAPHDVTEIKHLTISLTHHADTIRLTAKWDLVGPLPWQTGTLTSTFSKNRDQLSMDTFVTPGSGSITSSSPATAATPVDS